MYANQEANESAIYSNYSRSRLIDINNIKELNGGGSANSADSANYGKDTAANSASNSTSISANNNNENSPSAKQQNKQQPPPPAPQPKPRADEEEEEEDDDIIIEESSPTKVAPMPPQPKVAANITPVNGNGQNGATKIGSPATNSVVSLISSSSSILSQQLKRIAPKTDAEQQSPNTTAHIQPRVSTTSSGNSNHISRLLSQQSQQQPLAPQTANKASLYMNGAVSSNFNSRGPSSMNHNGHSQPQPQSQIHSHAMVSSTNTYCELCNARFSNPESYVAHMRNCHPNIPFGGQQQSQQSGLCKAAF